MPLNIAESCCCEEMSIGMSCYAAMAALMLRIRSDSSARVVTSVSGICMTGFLGGPYCGALPSFAAPVALCILQPTLLQITQVREDRRIQFDHCSVLLRAPCLFDFGPDPLADHLLRQRLCIRPTKFLQALEIRCLPTEGVLAMRSKGFGTPLEKWRQSILVMYLRRLSIHSDASHGQHVCQRVRRPCSTVRRPQHDKHFMFARSGVPLNGHNDTG